MQVVDNMATGSDIGAADEAKSLSAVPAGTAFTVPAVLFAKLTDEDLETYKERFGGAPE
jgi:methionyl-tRNA synthetase